MPDPGREALEKRLLVLAPIGKDAALTAGRLGSIGIECHVCRNVSALALELDKGAAGALIAEEALADGAEPLAALLARQPPWSDLPILVMTRTGADSTSVELALRTLGNVILLERPIPVAGGRVAYTKSAAEAIELVDAGLDGADAAFLLEPTPVASVLAVAADGDVMPQKSTYFYPKAMSGLIINPHEW